MEITISVFKVVHGKRLLATVFVLYETFVTKQINYKCDIAK